MTQRRGLRTQRSCRTGSTSTSRHTGTSGPRCSQALRDAGIRNYTIFRNGNEMFGYFESDDLEAAAAYMEAQEVNGRWQDAMAELLEERVPDAGPRLLEEVFRLE